MEGEAVVCWCSIHALPDGQQCSVGGAAAERGELC